MRTAVTALLEGCGFDLVGVPEHFVQLVEVVERTTPNVAVVALPVPGANGLAAVRELSGAAPDCSVVVLSSFPGLRGAALEAGARALVGEDDLRALQTVLLDVACSAAQRTGVVMPDQRTRVRSPVPVSLPAVDGDTAGRVTWKPSS
ncbi:MAG: hypothetical protein M3Q47_20710 [Actinomycetota bacterium]|nr:hypothetical protein [Actinomycetota bacterium]